MKISSTYEALSAFIVDAGEEVSKTSTDLVLDGLIDKGREIRQFTRTDFRYQPRSSHPMGISVSLVSNDKVMKFDLPAVVGSRSFHVQSFSRTKSILNILIYQPPTESVPKIMTQETILTLDDEGQVSEVTMSEKLKEDEVEKDFKQSNQMKCVFGKK